MIVVSACEQSGRICDMAKRRIGNDVLAIVYRCMQFEAAGDGYYFEASLTDELLDYFGMKKEVVE